MRPRLKERKDMLKAILYILLFIMLVPVIVPFFMCLIIVKTFI